MTALIIFLFTFGAYAQEFQYQVEGSFQTPDAAVVNYEVNWNETTTAIQGLYTDNFYASSGPKILTGEVNENGRAMRVILPEAVGGVRSIVLNTTERGNAGASIPMNVTVRDAVGANLNQNNGFALMSVTEAGLNNQSGDCSVGFGALTGYCGLYSGMVNELTDNAFRCDLLSGGNPQLELNPDTSFRFILTNYPVQNLGSVFPAPSTNSININSRTCAPIPGTTFVFDHCKSLTLSGQFYEQGSTIVFNGTYAIADEVNADTCTFSLSLRRERNF